MSKKTQPIEGQRLEEYLSRKKISQSFLAKTVETSTANVSNWVSNGVLPRGNQLRLIMKFFPDLNIRYWFLGEGSPVLSEEDLQRFKGQDLDKYKMALGEKEIELMELKNLNDEQRLTMQRFAALLEGMIPPEKLKELREIFERKMKK